MKRSKLVAAAKELNDVLGLKPAINVKGTATELEESLIEASALVNKEEDELSGETQEVLNTLIPIVTDTSTETKKEDTPKPEPKPEPKPKQETPPKESKTSKAKTKETKKKDHTTSNKYIVYSTWKDGETDVDKLLAAVADRVKKTTIRGWIGEWKKGNNLPAGVK